MKKVLALIMMFALVSVSSAAISLATDVEKYMPGDTVTVTVVADEMMNGFGIRGITATPNVGIANPGEVYPGYNFAVADGSNAATKNEGNTLFHGGNVDAIGGSYFSLLGAGTDCPAGTPLYTFTYVLNGDAPLGMVDLGVIGGVGTNVTGGTSEISGVSFEVVPEPMTLSLLGLGGLALIRRRRNA